MSSPLPTTKRKIADFLESRKKMNLPFVVVVVKIKMRVEDFAVITALKN